MQTKHTPGPWQVSNGRDGIARNWIGQLNHRPIAATTDNATAADAALIAAAPELLRVLTDAREALLDGRMADLGGILTGDVCADAIAKATNGGNQ